MAKLFISEGGKNAVYEIFDDEVTIGRGAASSVQVTDSHASKAHAVVRRLKGRLKLVDLESKNGTRVNGQFLNQRWLATGDTVTIGAAVLRFDAEGEATGAPAARAVAVVPGVAARPAAAVAVVPIPAPTAPRPVAAPARPAAATVRPEAAPARPATAPAPQAVPVARAAPPATRPAAPAARPGVGVPVSRRLREGEEVDETTGRRVHRRTGMSSSTIAVLGIGGAALLAVIIFLLAGSGGLSHNQEIRKVAAGLAQEGKFAEAAAYARQHGERDGQDWSQLEGEILVWEKSAEAEPDISREAEANKYMVDKIQRVTVTPQFHPKGAKSDAEVAELLRGFLATYAGTPSAQAVLNREAEPFITYRRILQEYAPAGQSAEAVMAEVERQIQIDVTGKRFGQAIGRLETLQATNRTTMQADAYADLRRKANERILALQQDARRVFDADLAEAKGIAARGDPTAARAKLQIMIETYGVQALVREAQSALDAIK